MASWREYPKMRSAEGFHAATRKFRSHSTTASGVCSKWMRKLLLRLAYLLLSTFAVGNIAGDSKQADDLAVGITIRALGRKIRPGYARGSCEFLVGLCSACLHYGTGRAA